MKDSFLKKWYYEGLERSHKNNKYKEYKEFKEYIDTLNSFKEAYCNSPFCRIETCNN